MKLNSCPSFSWSSATNQPTQRPRSIALSEPRRLRRDHAHTPCALHHKLEKVAYGEFNDFTRESNASGI